MATGKKTGGRKKGTPNKSTLVRNQEIAAGGELPLDYMLRVMRDQTYPHERRDEMAKAAAPYVHPRLSSSTLNVNRKRDATDWTRDELVAILHDAAAGSGGTAPQDGCGDKPDQLH